MNSHSHKNTYGINVNQLNCHYKSSLQCVTLPIGSIVFNGIHGAYDVFENDSCI